MVGAAEGGGEETATTTTTHIKVRTKLKINLMAINLAVATIIIISLEEEEGATVVEEGGAAIEAEEGGGDSEEPEAQGVSHAVLCCVWQHMYIWMLLYLSVGFYSSLWHRVTLQHSMLWSMWTGHGSVAHVNECACLHVCCPGIDGNVTAQCICSKSNCPKFHGVTKIGEIRGQNNVTINAVALCNSHIVCAGSDGTLTFYDAQYNRVHAMSTGGTCVKYLVAETFMGKDLLFWSMDVVIPTMGGVPVGVIQMMDFASLSVQAADPPTITVMVG